MATITYSFSIGKDTIPYSASTTITIDKEKYDLSLQSLRYNKKMFQPGKIEAKLLLKQYAEGTAKAPEMSLLVNYFKTQNKDVSLSKTVDGVETDIAKNYYVFKVIPEYKRGDDGQYVNVTLHIYSPDHKLTLDKYCRSYVNQKLVADVLMGELDNGILSKAGFTKDTFDGSLTHFLNYVHSVNEGKAELKEFLQPYLVQYNESFYDFIARTANRCGEFFYYENGKLYLGLNDFEEKDDSSYKSRVDINRDKALSIVYEEADDSLVNTSETRVDSLKKDFGSYTSSDYASHDIVSYDDFLEDYFEKDQFTSFTKELFPMQWKVIPQAIGALLTGGIAGAVAYVAGVFIPQVFIAKGYAKTKNDFKNKLWVVESDSGNGKQKHASEQYDSSNNKAVLYGSMLTDDVKKNNYEYALNLNQKFYTFISAGCREVGRHMIRVNVGTQQKPFLLGQKVTFESQQEVDELTKKKKTGDTPFDFDRYIIMEVNDVIKAEESNFNDSDWTPGQKVMLLPLYSVKSKKFSSSTESNLKLACPPVVRPFIRESGIQRAFVAESNDPNNYGRVCIRYPWQKQNDVTSPWIRVAVPYAPSNTGDMGGGMVFQHCVGDEVLVDYEGGNIEHPYVIGSLFNAKVKAPGSSTPFHEWNPADHPKEPVNQLTIASRKGHRLMFDDNGNAEDFLRSCLPGLDLLKPLTNKFDALRFDQDMNSAFSGGLTLSDKWGIYTISCSTTNRNIKINSPFGSVDVNAFTGISIKAECGDINIKGKNVTIEAGNELKLLSGTNISDEGESVMRDMVAKGIVTAVIDSTIAKLVDLTLVRCVMEVLLKPVAGTMTLKSRRYMLLMAGKGSAEIPNKGYSLKGIVQKEDVAGTTMTFNGSAKPWKWEIQSDHVVMANTLRLIDEQVTIWYAHLNGMYEAIIAQAHSIYIYPSHNGSHADIIKLAYKNMDNPITEDDINYLELVDVEPAEKTELLTMYNSLSGIMKSITDYAKKIKDGKALPPEDKFTYYKQLKKVITNDDLDPMLKDLVDKKEKFELTAEERKVSEKSMKRMLAYKIIEDGCVVEQVCYDDRKAVEFKSFKEFKDDLKWFQYSSNLKNFTGMSVKGAKGAFARFGLEVLDYLKNKLDSNFGLVKMFREKDIWSSAQNGEILFSDKDGSETLNFINGGLNHTSNEDGFDRAIRDILLAYK